MLHHRHFASALLLALPMTFVSANAVADNTSDLKRVEIRGQQRGAMPLGRTDVRKTCPGADQSLQQSLARAWYLEQKPGVVRVDFELSGQDISEVRSSGGPKLHYQKAIRQAVHQLSCNSPAAGTQKYTMLISFAAEEDAGQGSVVALLTP